MRVYISGAISGREPNEVRKEFELAKMYLRREGFEAISPLANGLPWNCSWEFHMREDLRLLLECQKIAMLPSWREPRCDAGDVYSHCVRNGSDLFKSQRFYSKL